MIPKMKKNKDTFQEIEWLKERQRLRISEQEARIRLSARELADNLTGVTLVRKIQENLFGGQGLAFRLGFMAVSLITDRLRKRRRK
jgi:hypothetical protein